MLEDNPLWLILPGNQSLGEDVSKAELDTVPQQFQQHARQPSAAGATASAAVPTDAASDGSDSADDEPIAAGPSKPAATSNPKAAAPAKKKAVHKDWFKSASDIKEILHFVRLNGDNVIAAVSKLCSLPHGCFQALAVSTVQGWMDMGTAKGALKTLLEDQRKSGAAINSSIIRNLTIGVLLVFGAVATTAGVVFDNGTTFSVSRQWCRKFASQEMGWSYRKATTTAQNLPKDWSVIKASNGQLPVDQKAVLLIDCWSVHKSEEFLLWMKEEYPHLIILFVPGGTTNKFQPADTGLNRPFKAAIKAAYHLWYAQDVGQQLQGHAVGEVKVGTVVGVMRDLSVGWLLSSWERLNGDASIVKKAWQITGLHAAFDRQVQRAVGKMRDAGKLWRVPQGYDAEIGDEDEQQLFSKGFDSEPGEDDLVPLVQLAARATAKAAGASSSTAATVASIQDVVAQATAAEEYLQIDEQLALQSEVLQAGMEAYAVQVVAAAAEAAADNLLALDENAAVDNVEGGEVAVEDLGHFDSAEDGEGDDDAMQVDDGGYFGEREVGDVGRMDSVQSEEREA
ncbi:unnamed protein product [Sphagnum jensenii]